MGPEASFVGTIESEKYDTPATSAILGENIYTANLRGAELPLLESGEDDLDTFNESFTLVKTSRLTLSKGVPTLPDIPQTAIANGSFETLVVALSAADLVGAVSAPAGPFTVFAPTDDAFAALPDGLVECLVKEENVAVLSDILLYHVVGAKVLSTDLSDGMVATTLNGDDVTVDLSDGVKIDLSTVIIPDVEASNGVIHVIDSVLVPADIDVAAFLQTCTAALTAAPTVSPTLPDIPQTAIANGSFETLVAALSAADLVGAVSAPAGPFTVFAPTDDAFAALPDGLVECLVKEENVAVLSDILLYHVVSGEVRSIDLVDGMTATTLNGDDVTVDLSDGVKIDSSTVILPDVEASNGVIHVIDSVLVPADIDVAGFLESCLMKPPRASSKKGKKGKKGK